MKEHKNDGERSRAGKKITVVLQHIKNTGQARRWDDVRILYWENNWKKRKFKEATRITWQNKEQLINKNDERILICNSWNIILKDKTSLNLQCDEVMSF